MQVGLGCVMAASASAISMASSTVHPQAAMPKGVARIRLPLALLSALLLAA